MVKPWAVVFFPAGEDSVLLAKHVFADIPSRTFVKNAWPEAMMNEITSPGSLDAHAAAVVGFGGRTSPAERLAVGYAYDRCASSF
jgi:hypothetical protein